MLSHENAHMAPGLLLAPKCDWHILRTFAPPRSASHATAAHCKPDTSRHDTIPQRDSMIARSKPPLRGPPHEARAISCARTHDDNMRQASTRKCVS